VPSSLTCTLALDSPPPLNQYPEDHTAPLIRTQISPSV